MKIAMNMSLYPTKLKKKWQGGIESTENPKEKPMYAVSCAGETYVLKTQTFFQKPTQMKSS